MEKPRPARLYFRRSIDFKADFPEHLPVARVLGGSRFSSPSSTRLNGWLKKA